MPLHSSSESAAAICGSVTSARCSRRASRRSARSSTSGGPSGRRDGFYDWREFDRLVERTARANIELLPLLYGTPDWIASNQATPPIYDAKARG